MIHIEQDGLQGAQIALLVLLATCPPGNGAPARRPGTAAGSARPLARISMPWNNSLVRADVPVFGVAAGKDFKQYRIEFGAGVKPTQWQVIALSRRPQPVDPWAAGKVKWDPNRGARGNLVTWQTGLTSYRYGEQSKNLNGVCTLRLVVESTTGKTAEARVVVNVARALTREMGGIAESSDGKVFLSAGPESTVRDGVLVGIEPVGPVENPPMVEIQPPKGLVPVGRVYELRPPGLKFVKPASFRMHYTDADLRPKGGAPLPEDRLGIYAYDAAGKLWRRIPCAVDPASNTVRADVTAIAPNVAFYGLCADVTPPPAPILTAPLARGPLRQGVGAPPPANPTVPEPRHHPTAATATA